MSNLSAVVREGWLKKVKNQKKRYFVLGFNKETGNAQLQYYESLKKFSAETQPKREISLQKCLGIAKKNDEKHGNILTLYSKDGIFRLIANTNEILEEWFSDLQKLHQMEYKNLQEQNYEIVWKVKVVSRGLGGLKNVTGSYNLGLKENVLYFVNPVTQEIPIEEKLYHVRKFGCLDNCVFMEFGRCAALGPGEIWMEVDDPLVAQKIHDSLSRSVRPKNARPNSVIEDDLKKNHFTTYDNNNVCAKTRRPTFIDKIIGNKSKWETRSHSNSFSSDQASSAEEPITYSNRKIVKNDDGEDSEERHYPKITPPAPNSKSPSSEDGFVNRHKNTLDLDTKSSKSAYAPRRRRTECKQDINKVRKNFVEQYNNSSLPRRTSSSSSGDRTWRRSVGSEQSTDFIYESDKDSDREDNDAFFQNNAKQYINMKPRQIPVSSDSSVDELTPSTNHTSSGLTGSDFGAYIPLRPPASPPDVYIQMSRPGGDGNSNVTASRSSEVANTNAYVNIKPGLPYEKSSTSSNEFTSEKFDHVDRGERNLLSNDIKNYVNVEPNCSRGKLTKSQSKIERESDNDYVNIGINRSKSVGSKSPSFRILPEKTAPFNADEIPSAYVNMAPNEATLPSLDESSPYANVFPQYQKECNSKKVCGKNEEELTYLSIQFSKNNSPRDQSHVHRWTPNGNVNYAKIDFEKSHVLADISSSRERQLNGRKAILSGDLKETS